MIASTTASGLVYLMWTMARNRTVSRIKRIRNPRYAIGAVLGVAYFWFVIGGRMYGSRHTDATAQINASWLSVATLGTMLLTMLPWIFGSDKLALAFTQAEAAFLFTAPVSRRTIVLFKMVRSQFAVLFSVLVWVVLFRNGMSPSSLYRGIGLWIFFSTMNAHRTGAALVRASIIEHGGHGARRVWVSAAVLTGLVAATAISLYRARTALGVAAGAGDGTGAMTLLNTALTTGPAAIALWPFRALIAPAFAQNPTAWAHALPMALLLLAGNVAWVLRSDAAFEEAAMAATEERVQRIELIKARQSGRSLGSKMKVRGHLPLAPTGPPAVAIIWKNALCLRRSASVTTLLLMVGFPLAFPFVLDFFSRDMAMADLVIMGTLMAAGFVQLFGPMLVRNDLRQDMLNTSILKTLPMSGRTLVASEIASSVVPVALVEGAMLIMAGVAALVAHHPEFPPHMAFAGLAFALPVALGLNSALVSVQNTAPVLLPAWTRMGTALEGGIEMMGQNMLSLFIKLLGFVLLMILPAAFAVGSVLLLRTQPALAMTVASVLALGVLAAELFVLINVLGGAIDRLEPGEVQ